MNVLFVSVTGHDERAGWSAVLVEPEGFFEEHQGVASSPERAFLWALQKTIFGLPDHDQLVIRSCDRHVLRWEDILSENPLEYSQHLDLLEDITNKLSSFEIKWFDASRYREAGDSRAQSLAKEALMSHQFNFEPKEIEFVTQMLFSSEPPSAPPPSQDPNHSKDSLISEECFEQKIEPSPPPEPTENKITPSTVHTAEPLNESDQQKIDDVKPRHINPIISSKTPLNIPVASEFLFGARILAYIDGIGMANIGAWGFVLVDRQTGYALLRAEGVRSTTPYCMRITAAIEALLSLKDKNQHIEIRSRYRNTILLGQNWMHTWQARDWTKKTKEPIKDLPFVQQLYDLCQDHRVSWCHISEQSDEQGIKDVVQLSKRALRKLNYGESANIEERKKAYPISLLI